MNSITGLTKGLRLSRNNRDLFWIYNKRVAERPRGYMKSEPGPPMTLGGAAAAQVRLIVWCKACHHQVEPANGVISCRRGWHKCRSRRNGTTIWPRDSRCRLA